MKETFTINGVQFTVWKESNGVGVLLADGENKIGEVFVEHYEGRTQAHVFHGTNEEPESYEI